MLRNLVYLLGIIVRCSLLVNGQLILWFWGLMFFLVGGWGVQCFFHKPSPPSINKVLIVQASHGMCPHAFEQKLEKNIKQVRFILFL